MKTIKERIIEGFLTEIKKISLGPLASAPENETGINSMVIATGPTFIRLNPEITIDDLNTFAKNAGSNRTYDDFVDFFIEYYSVNSTVIIKKYLKDEKKEIDIPIISFTGTETDTILINS